MSFLDMTFSLAGVLDRGVRYDCPYWTQIPPLDTHAQGYPRTCTILNDPARHRTCGRDRPRSRANAHAPPSNSRKPWRLAPKTFHTPSRSCATRRLQLQISVRFRENQNLLPRLAFPPMPAFRPDPRPPPPQLATCRTRRATPGVRRQKQAKPAAPGAPPPSKDGTALSALSFSRTFDLRDIQYSFAIQESLSYKIKELIFRQRSPDGVAG